MKKLLISASIGTAVTDAIERDIASLEKSYAEAFPEYEVRRAFTSSISRKKLSEQGIIVPSVQDVIKAANAEGFDSITIAMNMISPGDEYNRICTECEGYSVSRPLLDTEEDFRQIAEIFKTRHDNGVTLLMGHGSKKKSNKMYAELAKYLPKNVYIACMDGDVNLSELLPKLLAQPKRKITLIPFLLVAAMHVTDDMLGNSEKSWKTILSNAGFIVDGITYGLGSNTQIQEMYIRKVKAVL